MLTLWPPLLLVYTQTEMAAEKHGTWWVSTYIFAFRNLPFTWRNNRNVVDSFSGTAFVVFSFPLIFSPCPGCQDPIPYPVGPGTSSNETDTGTWTGLSEEDLWLRGLYYAILILVFQAGWAIVQISHLALIPDLTPIQSERAELTAIR